MNISHIIETQIPEHLREGSPLFSEFLKTYYTYASQQDKAVGMVLDRNSSIDIDTSSFDYIDKFYLTYGKYLPTTIAYDKRNLIKILNSVYRAKGTEKALKILFRTIFNQEIDVSYPEEHSLMCSGGTWVQDKFITIETISGIPPKENTFLSFTNYLGDFNFEASGCIYIGNLSRISFKSSIPIVFSDNQILNQYDTDGNITFTGILKKSPSHVEVIGPGKNWIVGQVIEIPGTIRDTIARVTSIDPFGGIVGIEILEYGYVHYYNQLITISAYDSINTGIGGDINTEMVSFSPLIYNHTLTISDYIHNIDEVISGDVFYPNSDDTSFEQKNIHTKPKYTYTTEETTVKKWIDSRAVLILKYDNVINTRGYYSTDSSLISNQSIRLHDNYFYQAFSYLLESAVDIGEYKTLLNITHPAGTKVFSTLAKTVSYITNLESSRTLSIDVVYLLDIYSAIDEIKFIMNKKLEDFPTITDALNILYAKYMFDGVSLSDVISMSLSHMFTQNIDNDFVVMMEQPISSITDNPYTSELYFTQQYSSSEYILSLG